MLASLQTHFTYARPVLRQRIARIGRRAYCALSLATMLLLAVRSWPEGVSLALCTVVFVSYLAMWLASLWVGRTRTHRGVVALDGDTVSIHADGVRHTLHVDQLREGSVRVGAMGWSLQLRDRRGDVYACGMPDEATATQWLDALGLDASRRAMRVVSNRTMLQWVFAYFFGTFFATPFILGFFAFEALLSWLGGAQRGGANVFVMYLSMAPGFWLAARAVGRVDFSIGADGVRAGRRLWRSFFPLARIVGAMDVGPVLQLRLTGGRTKVYRFQHAEDAQAVARRVNEVVALHRTPCSALPASLASAEALSATQWRDRFVHALREGGYRAAAFTPDDLEMLLRAKGVPAPQRLGAALALQTMAPAEAVTGVRIAADAMVDPGLRRALADEAVRTTTARTAAG